MNYIEVSKAYARKSTRPTYTTTSENLDSLTIYKRGMKVPDDSRFYVPASVSPEDIIEMANLQQRIEELEDQLDAYKDKLLADAEAYNSLGNEISYRAEGSDGVAATVSYANSLKITDKAVTGKEPFLQPKPVTYEVCKDDKEAVLLIMTDACKDPCRCKISENFGGWEMSTTGDVMKDAENIQRTLNCPRDEALRLAELYLKYTNGLKVLKAAHAHGLSYSAYVKAVKAVVNLGHSPRVTITTPKK